MAQRAIASFGKKELEGAPFASLTAADVIRAPIVERRVPVDFRPLLKAHKKSGRLSLRIERLPQGAKFSAGRRGEDNSWVLASDELEDLEFLVSSHVARDYQFTVRVMAFEGGEISTVKVVEFAVPASNDAAPVQPLQPGRDPSGPDAALRGQLSEAHALLAAREAELTELRAALENAASEKEAGQARGQSEAEAEIQRRIAEAVEQVRAQHAQEHEARESERKSRAAVEATVEKLAAEQERAESQLRSEVERQSERQSWETESTKRLEAARQEWKLEASRSLEVERQLWNAETTRRLESARREWALESGRGLESAQQAWAAESDARTKAEIARVRTESEQRIEAERQKTIAHAGVEAAKVLERWKSESDQRLETARQAWVAEAAAHAKGAGDSAKADIESRLETERQSWKAAAEEEIKKERARWESDVEQRLEAARLEARAQSEAVLVAECTRLEAEAEQRVAAERQRHLIENAAAAKAAVPQSDGETALKLAEEKNKTRQLDAALTAAASKNRDLETALAAMTLAREQAEQALAAAPVPDDQDGYIRTLQSEIATLRQSVVDQAAELGKVHAAVEQSIPLHLVHASHNLPIGKLRDIRDDDDADGRTKKSIMRDFMMVAAVVVPFILLYPWIAVYLPDGLRGGIATVSGGLLSVDAEQPAPVVRRPIEAAPAPKVALPTAVADRVLNVRATPATDGAVLSSLPKDVAVTVLGKQGNWTQIEIPAQGAAKPLQGWVWSAYLQAKAN